MSRLTNIALRRLEKALGPTGVEPERSQNEETPGEPENAQMLVAIGVDESPESSESDDWLAQFPSEGRDEPAAVESAMPPPTAASYPVADTDLDRFKSEDKSESAATEHAIADEKEYALRGRSTIFT